MKKPKVKVVGKDGNVFAILGACSQSLKRDKQYDKSKEMSERVFACSSYNEALSIMMEYVEMY